MEVKKPTIITYRNPTSDLDVLVEIESIAEKLSEQLLAVFNETGEIPKNLHLQLRKLKEEKPRDEENGMIAYIKLFMGYKKKSASSIAQEMGVSISTLTKFIQYDTRPTPATLEKIRNCAQKKCMNLLQKKSSGI